MHLRHGTSEVSPTPWIKSIPSKWLHTPSRNGFAYAKSSFHLSWSIEQPNSVMFLCMELYYWWRFKLFHLHKYAHTIGSRHRWLHPHPGDGNAQWGGHGTDQEEIPWKILPISGIIYQGIIVISKSLESSSRLLLECSISWYNWYVVR